MCYRAAHLIIPKAAIAASAATGCASLEHDAEVRAHCRTSRQESCPGGAACNSPKPFSLSECSMQRVGLNFKWQLVAALELNGQVTASFKETAQLKQQELMCSMH